MAEVEDELNVKFRQFLNLCAFSDVPEKNFRFKEGGIGRIISFLSEHKNFGMVNYMAEIAKISGLVFDDYLKIHFKIADRKNFIMQFAKLKEFYASTVGLQCSDAFYQMMPYLPATRQPFGSGIGPFLSDTPPAVCYIYNYLLNPKVTDRLLLVGSENGYLGEILSRQVRELVIAQDLSVAYGVAESNMQCNSFLLGIKPELPKVHYGKISEISKNYPEGNFDKILIASPCPESDLIEARKLLSLEGMLLADCSTSPAPLVQTEFLVRAYCQDSEQPIYEFLLAFDNLKSLDSSLRNK